MDDATKNYLSKLERLQHELETAMATDVELGPSSPIEDSLLPLIEKVETCIADVRQAEGRGRRAKEQRK